MCVGVFFKRLIEDGNVASFLDSVEADVDFLIDRLYGEGDSDNKENTSDYMRQIESVINNGPPYTDEQLNNIKNIIVPITFAYDFLGE